VRADRDRALVAAIYDQAARFNGQRVAEALVELFAIRGVPGGVPSDNGSEFTGVEVSGVLKAAGVEQLCVEAGCPWENGVLGSLNSILRNELLNTELFPTARSARNMATAWRLEYNHRRGHGALGYETPAEFAARQRKERQGNGSLITTGPKNRGKPPRSCPEMGRGSRAKSKLFGYTNQTTEQVA